MKRNLWVVGLPIVAGLGLTLASCENPAVNRGEDELQQPGAVPTDVDENDDDEDNNVPSNVPGQGINNQDDDDNDSDSDGDS